MANELTLRKALSLYQAVWLESEPGLGIDKARQDLTAYLRSDPNNAVDMSTQVKFWNAATGLEDASIIENAPADANVFTTLFKGKVPAVLASNETVLVNALLTERALIVLTDGLKFGPSVMQAALSAVTRNVRVVFVSASEPPPDFLKEYLKHIVLRYSPEELESDVRKTFEANSDFGVPYSSECLAPLNGLRPTIACNNVIEALINGCDTVDKVVHYLYQARRDKIEQDTNGVLRMEEPVAAYNELKGLGRAKKLLKALGDALRRGEDVSGVILLGIPGTGKTRMADATAGELKLPLYKTDFSAGFSKYVGETEQQFRRAIATLENLPPGIVLIDELEKVLAAVGNTGGNDSVGKRSGQYILRYMDNPKAANGGRHLILATSNDVLALPPEYVRAERWDALLWFGIPSLSILQEVLAMYVEQYGLRKDFGKGASYEKMTPAEIKSVCRIASRLKCSWKEALPYVPCLHNFRDAELEQMQSWAKTRTVSAEAPDEVNASAQVAEKIAGISRKAGK